LEDVHYKQRAAMGENGGTFRFGTLSSLVGHRARTAYIPLPPWASEETPSSLRDPEAQTAPRTGGAASAAKTNGAGFYDDSASDDSSSSSSDSSGSDSDSSDDEASDEDDESTSSEESSDGNVPLMPILPFASQGQQVPYSDQSSVGTGGIMQLSSMPQQSPAVQSYAAQPQTVDSSSDDSSDSGSDSDSSYVEAQGQSNSFGEVGNLIPMGGTPQLQHMSSLGSSRTNGSASSAADDLKGLVLEPTVVDVSENGEPNIEKDSSSWFEIVRAQHSGGLSVRARYLRGKTMTREVQLLGLVAEKSSTVCLQFRFENQ
jgi:hypothetical protein